MKHLLVTGAEGLLGRHIVRALVDAGDYRVMGVTRRSSVPDQSGVDWLTADLCQPSSADMLDGISIAAIVHTAAMLPRSLDDAKAMEVNRAIDSHVLQLARRTRASLVYLSSQSVYEHEPIPWGETQPVQPTSAYAVGKLDTERAVFALSASSASLRISSPYSAVDTARPGVLFHFVREAMAGRPLIVMGDGRRTQDFVHAADVARAVVAVLRLWWAQPALVRHDVFNIANGNSISMNGLAELVSSCSGSGHIEHIGADTHGDHRATLSIAHAEKVLEWRPQVELRTGVAQLVRRVRGSDEDWLAV